MQPSIFDDMAPRPVPEAMKLAAKNPLFSQKIRNYRWTACALVEASGSKERFNLYAGDPAEPAGVYGTLQLRNDRIFNTDFGESFNFNPKASLLTWFPYLLSNFNRLVNDWFDNPGDQVADEYATNCWQLAYVTLSIKNFENKRFFATPTGAIRWIASEAPGVLWRIITSQNAPDSPSWVKEADWAGAYKAAMDEAATEAEIRDVKISKKILCEYFFNITGLDTPEISMCRWLGFDEEDIEDM